MPRGLQPPERLSKDDIATLQALRRDIYSNAMIGGCKLKARTELSDLSFINDIL